jgi:hypothetical protein
MMRIPPSLQLTVGNVYTAGMFPSQSSEDASFFVGKYAPLSP